MTQSVTSKLYALVRNTYHFCSDFIIQLLIFFLEKVTFGKAKHYDITIVKLDGIGDYVLFRNFISELKNEFASSTILFVTSNAVFPLAQELDSELFDAFVAIDTKKIYTSFLYRVNILLKLNSYNSELLYNPVFTARTSEDQISKVIKAKKKYAYRGRTGNFYDEYVDLSSEDTFEFIKNKKYFETVLQKPLNIAYPHINKNGFLKKKNPNVAIVLGGSDQRKIWNTDKYVEVVRYVLENTQLYVYLLGGHSDVAIGNKIQSHFLTEKRVINICGQASFGRIVKLFESTGLAIGNDTGILHLAAASNVQVVCILKGSWINRFFPYGDLPDHPMPPIAVYEKMECFGCSDVCVYPNEVIHPCIDKISTKKVIDQLRFFLDQM